MHRLIETATGETKIKAVICCNIGDVLALPFAMLFRELHELGCCVIACDPPGTTSLEAAKPKWSGRILQFTCDDAENGALRRATVER